LKILIIDPCGETYNGHTLKHQGLGGSESAVIWMSQALTQLGHEIWVYNTVDKPGIYNGVHFCELSEFPLQESHHIVIGLRRPSCLFSVQAEIKILWIHDIYQDGYVDLHEHLANEDIHRIFCLSYYQKRDFMAQSQATDDDFWLTRNGCPQPEYILPLTERKENKFIYASRADRGLQYLLKYWPSIKRVMPEAELHVFDYRLSSGVEYQPGDTPEKQKPPNFSPEHMEGIENQEEIAMFEQEYEGIFWRGAITPDELIKEISEAKMILYPNIYPETSCIIAHMAVSCATPMLTSDFGALPEIINNRNGQLIPGTPRINKKYQQQFLKAFRKLIEKRVWEVRHQYCLRYKLSWLDVAREWEDFFKNASRLADGIKILVATPAREERSQEEQQHATDIHPPPGCSLTFMEVAGKDVATAREEIGDRAVDENFDYILFIDDDNIVPKRTAKILIESGEQLVSLNYYKKLNLSEETASCLAESFADTRTATKPRPEVFVAGMGCTLVKTEILKIIGKPYFKNTYLEPEPGGEDVYFFRKCRSNGIIPIIINKIWALHKNLLNNRLYGPKSLVNDQGKIINDWIIEEYTGLSEDDLASKKAPET
jgi:glycosyltransferase involved in cell wall biosynthesis